MHTDEKSYSCSVCNKQFAHNISLKKHTEAKCGRIRKVCVSIKRIDVKSINDYETGVKDSSGVVEFTTGRVEDILDTDAESSTEHGENTPGSGIKTRADEYKADYDDSNANVDYSDENTVYITQPPKPDGVIKQEDKDSVEFESEFNEDIANNTDLDPLDITDSDVVSKPDMKCIIKQEVEESFEYKLDMADGEDNKDDIELHKHEIDPDFFEGKC